MRSDRKPRAKRIGADRTSMTATGSAVGESSVEHDELLPLPPLDDDGGPSEAQEDIEPLSTSDETGGMDDQTGEGDAPDAWLDRRERFVAEPESGYLDDGIADDRVFEGGDGLMSGAEAGLLEGCEDGGTAGLTADEAGVASDEPAFPSGADDGGEEGTGDDPAMSIAAEANGVMGAPVVPRDGGGDGGRARGAPPGRGPIADELDDEGIFDGSPAIDDPLTPAFEREPRPPSADLSWDVELVRYGELGAPGTGGERASVEPGSPLLAAMTALGLRAPTFGEALDSHVVVASPARGVFFSEDGGARFVRIAGSTGATAVALIPRAPRGLAAVFALYDVAHDSAALAVVRVVPGGAPVAEVVADLPTRHVGIRADLPTDTDGDEELAEVESLRVSVKDDGEVEVVTFSRFGALRVVG